VSNGDVGCRSAGWGTPHRNVIGGLPHAAVLMLVGSVVRRPASNTLVGKARLMSLQTLADGSEVGLGGGTATAVTQPLSNMMLPTAAGRRAYTRMSLTFIRTELGDSNTMPQLDRNSPISEVGERALIAAISDRLKSAESVELGPGDDAAVLRAPDGRVVVSTDVLVAGRHFRTAWSSARDIGRRVAAANLSDINAMGARPTALVVGLVLPPSTLVGWVLDLADGLSQECALVGAAVIGGDLSSGDEIVITATALGDLEGRRPLTRSGARSGDIVAVAGRLGWAAAGLTILSRGFKSPRKLVDAHRYPHPPYAAGTVASDSGATAMLDVSDGLVSDLGLIALSSGVAIELDTARIPVDDPVLEAAAAFNVDPLIWMLAGGDDHALAATFRSDQRLPPDFTAIGRVTVAGDAGPRVLVDGVSRSDLGGYEHFS
jgi:thiamine-monophosphate kinase